MMPLVDWRENARRYWRYVEISVADLLERADPGRLLTSGHASRWEDAAAAAYLRVAGQRLFYELAGAAAKPIASNGMLWQRHDERDAYIAWFEMPSPEGLLLP